jgi:uncharacterized protein
MSIAALLKDPEALYAEMQAFAGSKERVQEGLAHMSYLDGLMTAVAISPELIRPSEWMPLATGPLDRFGSAEEAQIALSLTVLQFNKVLESLSGSEDYEPLFWTDEDQHIVTGDWAGGFIAGANLRRDAWETPQAEDHRILLGTVAALRQDDEIRAKAVEIGLDPDQLHDEALYAAPRLIQFLFDRSGKRPAVAPAAPVRIKQRTGRNDPCPCGSGKKYKKCCLN